MSKRRKKLTASAGSVTFQVGRGPQCRTSCTMLRTPVLLIVGLDVRARFKGIEGF